MKLTEKTSAVRILPVNRTAVKQASDRKLKDTPYYHLLLLLAEGCDQIALDTNFFCTLGSTKKGDSLTLSVNLDGERQTLYDTSLVELAVQAADLHDPL